MQSRRSKYSIQKKEYFSIRKFKFGAASALIGVSLFATGAALAEEQTQIQSAAVTTQASADGGSQTVLSEQSVSPSQDLLHHRLLPILLLLLMKLLQIVL